jgi:hypothetical protein
MTKIILTIKQLLCWAVFGHLRADNMVQLLFPLHFYGLKTKFKGKSYFKVWHIEKVCLRCGKRGL